MGEEIAFKNGRISDFQGLVTLTLDRVILHTVMHHLSTSNYVPNFIEIKETFCGRTDKPTDVRTVGRTHVIRSTRRIRPKNERINIRGAGVKNFDGSVGGGAMAVGISAIHLMCSILADPLPNVLVEQTRVPHAGSTSIASICHRTTLC